MAERRGFEPPVPFGTRSFQDRALDQLCDLSMILLPELVEGLLLIAPKIYRIVPKKTTVRDRVVFCA